MTLVRKILKSLLKSTVNLIYLILEPVLFIIVYLIVAPLAKLRDRDKVIWAYSNIINTVHWAKACRASGYNSESISEHRAMSIHKHDEFDRYASEFLPKLLQLRLFEIILKVDYKNIVTKYIVLIYIINNAEILFIDFSGGPLRNTLFQFFEASIYRRAKVKLIGSSFGADFYRYSKVSDLSVRHALNVDYRELGTMEVEIEKKVMYWSENFDCIFSGTMTDAKPIWDILSVSPLCLDTTEWRARNAYSDADGTDKKVTILHLSNHSAYTGKHFIEDAVAELEDEGYSIEFICPTAIKNSEVKELLHTTDIYVDGIIATGYGLAAIESMSSGTCTLVNFEVQNLTDVFRRYSYLNECPAVSVNPESLKTTLRYLIQNPAFRRELGELNRQYVQKYHSFECFKYWFDCVYRNLVMNGTTNLSDIFDPLSSSSYNSLASKIEVPLDRNKIKSTRAMQSVM